MSKKELSQKLNEHQHWLNADCDGWEDMKANLSCADLSGANLRGVNLSYADLSGADLRNADLKGAALLAIKKQENILLNLKNLAAHSRDFSRELAASLKSLFQ